MSLLDNPTCPRCHTKRTCQHCTSPTCTWTVCKSCTSKLKGRLLIFDVKKRVMEGHA